MHCQRRIDADDLRVCFAVKETREAIEGATAHANAGGSCKAVVLLVEQHAERQVERLEADAFKFTG